MDRTHHAWYWDIFFFSMIHVMRACRGINPVYNMRFISARKSKHEKNLLFWPSIWKVQIAFQTVSHFSAEIHLMNRPKQKDFKNLCSCPKSSNCNFKMTSLSVVNVGWRNQIKFKQENLLCIIIYRTDTRQTEVIAYSWCSKCFLSDFCVFQC